MDDSFRDLPGILIFMDDIAIFGRTLEECKQRTDAAMARAKELNLTLNLDKCKIGVTEINFLGMTLNKDGIHPTYSKVQALRNMRPPTKISELRGFLGLFNFYHTFIPNHTEYTVEMRKLTKKNIPFEWTPAMQAEFDVARNLIETNAARSHFDQNAYRTIIYTDASTTSLGAMMTQIGKPGEKEKMVMCASKATTEAEANYGQDGLEAAAVGWIYPKWNYYTLARKTILRTDASALTYILGKDTSKVIRDKRTINRAKSFALKLANYDFDVEYIKGIENPADAFSRLSLPDTEVGGKCAELFEIQAADGTWKRSITQEDVRERTQQCSELKKVMLALDTGTWSPDILHYHPMANDYRVINGILTRHARIVPPVDMREEILHDSHIMHPGIVAMKNFVRQRSWWPDMNKQIEDIVKNCYPCILNSQGSPPTPSQFPNAPNEPWEVIAIDLHSHKPLSPNAAPSVFQDLLAEHGKKNLLVILDLYSRYIHMFPMERTTASAVIALLKLTFSFLGRPKVLKSDNGMPFASKEYKQFLETEGIEAAHSTPYWPQHNAHVERTMKTINARLRKATIEGESFETVIAELNIRYNEWTHSQIGVSPFVALMRREPRLAMPSIIEVEPFDEGTREREQRLKFFRKIYTDNKKKATLSKLKPGDYVVLRSLESSKTKMSPNYQDHIYKILDRDGPEVLVQSTREPHKCYRRNVNVCKLVPDGCQEKKDLVEEQNLRNQEAALNKENEAPASPQEDESEVCSETEPISETSVEVVVVPKSKNLLATRKSSRARKPPVTLSEYQINELTVEVISQPPIAEQPAAKPPTESTLEQD